MSKVNVLVVLLMMVLLLSSGVMAQDNSYAGGRILHYLNGPSFIGPVAGFELTDDITARGSLMVGSFGNRLSADFLYNFDSREEFKPYAGLGLSRVGIMAIDFIGGAERSISNGINGFGEVLYSLPLSGGSGSLAVSGGVTFNF